VVTKPKARPSGKTAVLQFILVGAGLGLYFGLFFRPLREPNFAVAVALALLATAVFTIPSLLKKNRPTLGEWGKTAVTTFVKFALILSLLEVRHYVYDLGGKWLVAAFTTLLGAAGGYWMAQRDK
jgi:drug/metabolite transporter (DMT)-like permease